MAELDFSPPWILFSDGGKPKMILPAGRSGEIADVSTLSMEQAQSIVIAANMTSGGSKLARDSESQVEIVHVLSILKKLHVIAKEAGILKPDAYTIGNKSSYDKTLEETGVRKIGRRHPSTDFPDGYEGGWVWKTPEDARIWLQGKDSEDSEDSERPYRRYGDSMISFDDRDPVLCDVYGLLLPNGLDIDVEESVGQNGVYCLINDALIIKSVP